MKMDFKMKKYVIGSILLLIIGITVGVLFIVRNKATSSPKVYVDSTYGYSFSYPAGVTITTPNINGDTFVELPKKDGIFMRMTISPYKNPSSLSTKEFYSKIVEEAKVEHQKENLPPVIPPISTNDTVVNGVKAFQYVGFAGDGEILHTLVTNGKTVIDFSYYNDENNPNFPDNIAAKKIFEQIISTFKFN